MSSASTKKVFIQIESEQEQKEHIKNQRKTLKVLQGVASDKENLAGRPEIDRLTRLKSNIDTKLASSEGVLNKRKKNDTRCVETQTETDNNAQIIEDLTTDAKPSEHYWERLAEKRREALEEALTENQRMHERVESLEEELNTTRQLLEESNGLVEVLKQMLSESETEGDEAEGVKDKKREAKDDDSDDGTHSTESTTEPTLNN